jgi:hypothetical protein
MSVKNLEGNKSPDIYDGINQRTILCSQAEREGHRNVRGQLRLSLEATFKEKRAPKCALADRTVVGSNIQKRKGHQNVQGRIRLSLGATFKRGKDTEMSIGR